MPQEYPVRGLDQLQLGQVDRGLPALQVLAQVILLMLQIQVCRPVCAKGDLRRDLQHVFIGMAPHLNGQLRAIGEQGGYHIRKPLGLDPEGGGQHVAAFLRAFGIAQADPAILAVHNAAFPFQGKLHRRGLFVFDHQHAHGEFIPAAYGPVRKEHQAQAVVPVEDPHVFPAHGLQ